MRIAGLRPRLVMSVVLVFLMKTPHDSSSSSSNLPISRCSILHRTAVMEEEEEDVKDIKDQNRTVKHRLSPLLLIL